MTLVPPSLNESECEYITLRIQMLLDENTFGAIRRQLKTRTKSPHASRGRRIVVPSADKGLAVAEHFGIDSIDSAVRFSQGDPAVTVYGDGGEPVGMLHWQLTMIDTSTQLQDFEDNGVVLERLYDWLDGLPLQVGMRVNAHFSFDSKAYKCIVPLPLQIPRANLGAFSSVDGVSLMKKQDDKDGGALLYEVEATKTGDTLRAIVDFRAPFTTSKTVIRDALSAAKNIAGFAVIATGETGE